jgi:septal ring factor EnvC (AmiA/AmiB activator)
MKINIPQLVFQAKTLWTKIQNWLTLILFVSLVICIYVLNIKDKKIDAIKAQMELADTTYEANQIEEEIKDEMSKVGADTAKIAEFQKLLNDLDKKRKQIDDSNKPLDDKEIEKFWEESK